MSQQEKVALKKAANNDLNSAGLFKSEGSSSQRPIDDLKQKARYLRPSTPPGQTGSKISDSEDASPSSQACTSGSVTPNSEGVRRSDRKPHAPPGGLDLR